MGASRCRKMICLTSIEMFGIERHQCKDYSVFEEHYMLVCASQSVEHWCSCEVALRDLVIAVPLDSRGMICLKQRQLEFRCINANSSKG